MDFYRNDKFRQCHLIFEKATLIVDFIKGKIFYVKKIMLVKQFFQLKMISKVPMLDNGNILKKC